jgi:hypothetical protein
VKTRRRILDPSQRERLDLPVGSGHVIADQSRFRPEILFCDDVRPAAVRICADRLTVRHVENREEKEDRDRDRTDVVQADDAERHQDREGGFRTVSRRRKSIEAEHGNASQRTELFLLTLPRCEAPTKNAVDERHSSFRHAGGCR